MIDTTIELKPKSWSLSALHQYESCAFQYYVFRTKQIEMEKSPALEMGIEAHLKLEHKLLGDITGMPPELKRLEKQINNLVKHKAQPEREINLNSNWQETEGKFAKDTWFRCAIDASINFGDVFFIMDLKTGRSYPKYQEQAELYATAVFQVEQEPDTVEVEFWYSKTGSIETYEFSRDQQQERISKWEERIQPLFNDTEWKPTVSDDCKWCALKGNGCPVFK